MNQGFLIDIISGATTFGKKREVFEKIKNSLLRKVYEKIAKETLKEDFFKETSVSLNDKAG